MGKLILPPVLVLLAILMLEGCGQKGALYLPSPTISPSTVDSVPPEKQKLQTP